MACAPIESCRFRCELDGATSQLHVKTQHFDDMPAVLSVLILCRVVFVVARRRLVFQLEFWEAAGFCNHGPPQSGASYKPLCCTLGMRMNSIQSTSPCSLELGNEVWTPPPQGGNFHWPHAASTPHSHPHCPHMELTGHRLGKQQHVDLWQPVHARMREPSMKNDQNKTLSCNRRMWLARNHADDNMGQSTALRSH